MLAKEAQNVVAEIGQVAALAVTGVAASASAERAYPGGVTCAGYGASTDTLTHLGNGPLLRAEGYSGYRSANRASCPWLTPHANDVGWKTILSTRLGTIVWRPVEGAWVYC